MTDYSGFRKSPDTIDWMRAAPGQYFTRQLIAKLEGAHDNLVATCNKSSDPKVTAAVTLWNELDTLVRHFKNAARESIEE